MHTANPNCVRESRGAVRCPGSQCLLQHAHVRRRCRQVQCHCQDISPCKRQLRLSPAAPPSLPPSHKLFLLQLFFQIFGKGADKAQRGNPKTLCDSIDSLSGCLGLTYHVRFPPDYPEKAPLVRMLTPHVSGGNVLGSGAVCCDILLDKFWKATRASLGSILQTVVILHCDNSPMRATGAGVYPSEKAAKETYTGFLVLRHALPNFALYPNQNRCMWLCNLMMRAGWTFPLTLKNSPFRFKHLRLSISFSLSFF